MENNRTDAFLIQQYLEGKLDGGQMHNLERRAIDDPFLGDALEGFIYSDKTINSQLSILQRQLEERITLQHENKNLFNFTWQRLSIAAAAGLMFISAGILFWMNIYKRDLPPTAQAKKADASKSYNLPPIIKQPTFQESPRKNEISPSKNLIAKRVHKAPKAPAPVDPEKQSDNEPIPGLSEIAIMGTARSRASTSPKLEIKNLVPLIGHVNSKVDGRPLSGVSILLKNGRLITSTNNSGEFILPDSVKGILIIKHEGFLTKEENIIPGSVLNILLEPKGN